MEHFAPGLSPSAQRGVAHHEFRPDINGLRALAVLSVLGFHAGLSWLPGGFGGVDIFFVISGFLISRIILSERDAHAFSLADFYGKRVKRILPALLIVLAACWLAGWLLLEPPEFRQLGGHMEASSYFTVNLWLFRNSFGPAAYFDPLSRQMPLLHLWSLSIEEQFYLVWPALMLLLFRVRRWIAPAIGLIFLSSLAFCIYLTRIDSTAAFYFLSARAWELALGALLAQREVFGSPPRLSPTTANVRAGLGVILMVGAIVLMSESASWPGWLALVPTLGCALVIATPGAAVSRVLLENAPAQFFGRISYPLYLWHWPLLSFAHHSLGDHLPAWLAAGLMALAVLLSFLTWTFVELPLAAAYRKRPVKVALLLLAALASAGLLGLATRQNNGFRQRFPAAAVAVFDYRTAAAAELATQSVCADLHFERRGALDEEREIAHAFFADAGCARIKDPTLPTIVVVGDSHAVHLLAGLESVYSGRANLVMLGAIGCAPLIAQTEDRSGISGSARCRALNEEVARNIVALKPVAIVVAAYFAEFYAGAGRLFPGFLKDFDANVAALRAGGVDAPIFVMGQVPTWSPGVPTLVGRDMVSASGAREYSADNLSPDSRAADERLAAHEWGDRIVYLSQFKALCDQRGCRRMVGPRLPEDMIAWDYGHYTQAGSIYAVKTILEPALDAVLAGAR